MEGIYKFLDNSKKELTPEKDRIRSWTITSIHEFFLEIYPTLSKKDRSSKRIKFLTLPGAWWISEKQASKKFWKFNPHMNTHFTGCEKDLKIFNLAAAQMKSSRHYGLRANRYNKELDCQVITNGDDRIIINTDIFKYMEITDKKFDVIWIDGNSIITSIDRKLKAVANVAKDDCVFVLTMLKGRENGKLPIQRNEYVSAIMYQYGFNLEKTWEYFDSSPMVQYIFTRRKTIEKPLELII